MDHSSCNESSHTVKAREKNGEDFRSMTSTAQKHVLCNFRNPLETMQREAEIANTNFGSFNFFSDILGGTQLTFYLLVYPPDLYGTRAST